MLYVLRWLLRGKAIIVLAVLNLLALTAGFVVLDTKTTTAVSAEEALEKLRRSPSTFVQSAADRAEARARATAPPTSARRQGGGRVGGGASGSTPGTGIACSWDCPTDHPPPDGSYTWYQCGRTTGSCTGEAGEPQASENVAGVRRQFPRLGRRNITVTSRTRWTVDHYYADEHEERFYLSGDLAGSYSHRYRVVVSALGRETVNDIREQPPTKAVLFPLFAGKTWRGSWRDPGRTADGTYTVRVLGQEVIQVGSAAVRTWVVEIKSRLKGPKVTGTFDLTLWISPALAMSVQERYLSDLSVDQGVGIPYRGEWMITLADLEARTPEP